MPVALDKSADTHAVCSCKTVRQSKLESRVSHHVDESKLFGRVDIVTPRVLVIRSNVVAIALTFNESVVIRTERTSNRSELRRVVIESIEGGVKRRVHAILDRVAILIGIQDALSKEARRLSEVVKPLFVVADEVQGKACAPGVFNLVASIQVDEQGRTAHAFFWAFNSITCSRVFSIARNLVRRQSVFSHKVEAQARNLDESTGIDASADAQDESLLREGNERVDILKFIGARSFRVIRVERTRIRVTVGVGLRIFVVEDVHRGHTDEHILLHRKEFEVTTDNPLVHCGRK